MKSDKTVLLFSKIDWWSNKVYDYLNAHFKEVYRFRGDWGHPLPKRQIENIGEVDYVISYLCPWILPKWVLDKAKEHAINFHPAPPKYPGIGGYNYAIWNEDETYGVMVHEMAEVVDSGKIYSVWKLPISEKETVKSLKEKSMVVLFNQFKKVIKWINNDNSLDSIRDTLCHKPEWHTPPYTRVDFKKACEILTTHWPDWITKHIKDKVQAFYFPGARDFPFIEIDGKKYKVTPIDE